MRTDILSEENLWLGRGDSCAEREKLSCFHVVRSCWRGRAALPPATCSAFSLKISNVDFISVPEFNAFCMKDPAAVKVVVRKVHADFFMHFSMMRSLAGLRAVERTGVL